MIDPAATAWVDECLAPVRRTGALELFRTRMWADIHRAPTTAGTVWLKTLPPGLTAEVRLYPVLAAVVPERVLRPYGADPRTGRLLLPDGGASAGDRFTGTDLETVMTRALSQYARLQRDLAPHVDDLLAAGVPDMRPAMMPGRFDEALAGAAAYVHARGTAEEQAGYAALQRLRPTYERWCAQLAASGVAASIDHNDLHANNVIGSGGPADFEARFWDWGDSAVAHPFASLLFVLETMPVDTHDRLREAYLAEFGAPSALRAEVDLAVRVGQVARALVWQRALPAAAPDHRYAREPLAHLLRLLA